MNTIKTSLVCFTLIFSSTVFASMEEGKTLLNKGEFTTAKILFEAERNTPQSTPIANSYLARIAWSDKDFYTAEKLINKQQAISTYKRLIQNTDDENLKSSIKKRL
ncbi:MAG: hypothetical protein IMF09_03495 [Proteobacteria bacterium]|nr:hypothetical protein [Pseudomonadota bacterium]